MRPILFSLGSLNFYSYGFFTALGFVAAGFLIDYLARKKKLITSKHREFFLIDTLLLILVVGIVVARASFYLLYSVILQGNASATSIASITSLQTAGFIFLPGLLAGFITLAWWLRRHQLFSLVWFDIMMPGIFVAFGLSEIGGYLNDGLIVHLAGLLGSILMAGVSYLLVRYEKRMGTAFLYSLVGLFIFLFFLGFWRIERVDLIGLNITQWTSLLGLIAVSGGLRRHRTVNS
jgi:phosphatidylglycerol:prolipoprotein diacylglycerol transferase